MALPLRDSPEAQQRLATRLYQEFHASKTYGKEPESLESIIPLFTQALAGYSIERIEQALNLHAQRSQEFPTRFDIVNLITRNGKPPLSEAMYVSISKKDPELRDSSDWQYLREYEHEQKNGSESQEDDAKLREDNTQLRRAITRLEQENRKLADLLHETRLAKGLEQPRPTVLDRVQKTIDEMKRTGAKQEDIDTFAAMYGVTAS